MSEYLRCDYCRKTIHSICEDYRPAANNVLKRTRPMRKVRAQLRTFQRLRYPDCINYRVKHKLIEEQPNTYVIIFETGDELAAGLRQFALEHNLSAASFKAIGALSSVKLGWFDWDTKKYKTSVSLNEQVELLSLIGDVAQKDGQPQVHAHLVIGKSDGTAHGGHLQEAKVRPTCEVILTETPAHLQKQIDPDSGIALIKL